MPKYTKMCSGWIQHYPKRKSFIQQTFVFMKTSSRRIYSPNSYIFRRRLQDHFKTSWSRPIKSSCLYVFKTSSRRLAKRFSKTFSTGLQDIFNTSSRDLAKKSSRHLQNILKSSLKDVLKMYPQVKLFLLTRFQNNFETYSERFWNVLQRRISVKRFA